MEHFAIPRRAVVTAILFGVIPCLLGIGLGQYLRWRGTVWLSDAGLFWPTVCLASSAAILVTVAVSPSKDRAARAWVWPILPWTWLFLPLWATAQEIPQSAAVVTRDGHVHVVREWARQPSDRVRLLTQRAGDKIVHNVSGSATINAADVQYHYAKAYISRRSNAEDLSTPVALATGALLAEEAGKSRSSRIALFDKREVHERFLGRLCRAIVPEESECPLKLSLTPRTEATLPGEVWSRTYTEREAIDEKHLPTLVQLLTQDNPRLADRDRVLALFMDLAETPEALSTVARKSGMLDAAQFDELIRRIIASPGCGNEAVNILVKVNRLTQEHRRELRAKALREAGLALVANSASTLRISDPELAQLALRMRASSELTPEAAVLVLEKFGERLPLEAQREAVASIVGAKASHALAALKHVNFSSDWRERLVAKVVSDATLEDFDAARLPRDALEELLTPQEMRSLVAAAVRKAETSAKWRDFAARTLPVRAMTPPERKVLLNELLFESSKIALEFVSEYRHYLETADVNEVTYDYTKTVTPDFCLHLSHRNTNRRTDYFSEAQLQIFRDCAQPK